MVQIMTIIPFQDHSPKLHPSVYIAEGVRLIGDIELAEDSSVWFNSVLRADINRIRVGERTNIQDASILHVTEDHACIVGNDVTVGHRAIIHAATVEDFCLIGMGSVVLDNARIGRYSLVAAGAVVVPGFVVPEGSLVAGVPARIVRQLNETEREVIRNSALNYVKYAKGFKP
jgi:carbonic anhydrase/acetyltransferase-like protein (isoleucine patch superfamily)